MPGEIPLSHQLLTEAQGFARIAHQKKLTNKQTLNQATREIGGMLTQLPADAAQIEYFRIQTEAIMAANKLSREQGPAAAAQFLLGHAAAAFVLEDMLQLKETRPSEKEMATLTIKTDLPRRINKHRK